MGWTIEIGDPVDKTLNANFGFDLQQTKEMSDSGIVTTLRTTIRAAGSVVASPADAVADEIVSLSNTLATETRPRRVVLKLDGVTKFDFKTTESIGSPYVASFRTLPEDDPGESHWRWELEIFVLQGLRDTSPADVIDFTTSLEITKQNGRIVRKVWKAAAKARSVSQAEAAVRGFKPAETKIREIVETFAQESRATGVWIWEARDGKDLIAVEETVSITGIGVDYVFDTRVGDAGQELDPVIHKLPPPGVMVTIRGRVKGFDQATLAAPAPHLDEDRETVVRARAREEIFGDDPVTDADFLNNGLFVLDYMEVWMLTDVTTIPLLDHADHAELVVLTPPPDGSIKNP